MWEPGDTQHWNSFYLFQTTQTQFLTNSFQLELKACQTVVIGNICPSCCGFRNNQKSFYFPFQRPKQQLTFLIYNQLFKNIWRAIPFLHLWTDSCFKVKQIGLFQEKTRSWVFLIVSLMSPLRIFSLFAMGIANLVDTSPTDFQRQGFWGLSLSDHLKSQGARCQVQTLHSRLNSTVPGWSLWQECVPASAASVQVGFFLFLLMCRNHSASFWVSFRGNCSICSCRFAVSVGRSEFRGLLCFHLGLEHKCFLKNKKFTNYFDQLINFLQVNGKK